MSVTAGALYAICPTCLSLLHFYLELGTSETLKYIKSGLNMHLSINFVHLGDYSIDKNKGIYTLFNKYSKGFKKRVLQWNWKQKDYF